MGSPVWYGLHDKDAALAAGYSLREAENTGRALHGVARALLRTTQPAVADGFLDRVPCLDGAARYTVPGCIAIS